MRDEGTLGPTSASQQMQVSNCSSRLTSFAQLQDHRLFMSLVCLGPTGYITGFSGSRVLLFLGLRGCVRVWA